MSWDQEKSYGCQQRTPSEGLLFTVACRFHEELASNFNQKVMHHVMDLAYTCQPGPNKLEIYVTGVVMFFVLRCQTI